MLDSSGNTSKFKEIVAGLLFRLRAILCASPKLSCGDILALRRGCFSIQPVRKVTAFSTLMEPCPLGRAKCF